MPNLLHISPDFNYACGVSKHVFQCLEYFSGKERYNVYFITNGGDALANLKEINIEPFILNFTRGWKNIFNIKSNVNSVLQFCNNNKIDIIHTHHRYMELVAYKVSKKNHVKTAATVHSFVSGYNNLSFHADKLIAVSESVKKHLIKNYKVGSSKISTIRNFIEHVPLTNVTNKNLIRSKLEIDSNKKILLFAGRICYDKGINVLLEAFEIIKKTREDVTLLLVGSIDSRFKKKYWPSNEESIRLLPSTKNINEYYSIADIIVLPSRIDPFPFVMLETGLQKLPFIGGDTGGIQEFIRHMENGLLVQPGSSEDLAEKIILLLNDEVLRKLIGENLYNDVLPLTNSQDYFSQIEKIYNELIHNEN